MGQHRAKNGYGNGGKKDKCRPGFGQGRKHGFEKCRRGCLQIRFCFQTLCSKS